MIVVRTLLAAMFLFASLAYFLKMPQPAPTGNIKVFMEGLTAVVYLMPLLKSIELICGICLLVGRFVPLVTIVLFPILINIICFHAFLEPAQLPLVILLLAFDLFLAYYYRDRYKPILSAK